MHWSPCCRVRLLELLLAAWCLLCGTCCPLAAGQGPGEADEELARQKQVVERFLAVLERNPRRGTALDRVYDFHVENGSLDEFIEQLRERVKAEAADGTGWMLLGL